MTSATDTTFWQAILASDYAVPEGHSLDALTKQLFSFLASTDPVLRDEFGYMILANWLYGNLYSPEQKRDLLAICLQNLQKGLGEIQTESVLLRSFSILIIAEIIERDNEIPFLERDEVLDVLAKVQTYSLAEQDVRGYVAEWGWAHSTAHTADVFNVLAQNSALEVPHLVGLLDTIASKISAAGEHVYVHNEDERLATALMSILDRNLVPLTTWQMWINTLADTLVNLGFDPARNAIAQNIRNLLRTFYFHLAFTSKTPQLLTEVREAVYQSVKKTDRFIS